ncbi:MAG: hypothetical protein HYV14_10950 [Elusimicrobia bacterium]|nr:hypothetical protein [Elusimicrobiota bacterium]
MKYLLLLALLPLAVGTRAEEPAPSAESRIKSLEERLGKLEGAPAKTSLSAFNPAMGAALDFTYGHSNGASNFNFRTAELNIEAPIDPFLKGWIVLNASPDGVEAEEATLQTTALPYNLTVAGGRLFAAFGRLAHFHNHELPVIDRPLSLENFIGGETQADGVEVSYLFPTPFYLNATAGAYNKLGGENARADNAAARPMESFTYLGRLAAYADLGDDHSLELGVSEAWTPRRYVMDTSVAGTDYDADGTPDAANTSAGIQTRKNTWRTLSGVDLTYRWQPAAGGIYKGAVWGTEVMQNNERRFDPATNLPTDRVRSYAGFSYLQFKLGRHWRPGVMIDLTEDLDTAKTLTRTFTGFVTYDVTEFQRLRLAFSRTTDNRPEGLGRNAIGLQWTGVFGRHVHGFRDR